LQNNILPAEDQDELLNESHLLKFSPNETYLLSPSPSKSMMHNTASPFVAVNEVDEPFEQA